MAGKNEAEIQIWQTVAPVEFAPKISNKSEAQSLLILSRQGAGFPVAGGQFAHAIQSRATHVLLDYSQSACAIRYQVDGAWEQLPALDRETGDGMLYTLKQLCLLNPADRRSAQTGSCGVKVGKVKFSLMMQAKGTPSGERVLIRIDPEKIPFDKMSELGMRDKMFESFKEKIDAEGNIFIISAPKGEGLTTTWIVALNAADRLVRDFQSFEEQASSEAEVININPNFFGGDTGLTQEKLVLKAALKEPDVLIFPELPSPEALKVALENVAKLQKQIYTRIVAPNAITALVEFVNRYPARASEIAKYIGGVLNQKLVRRLCDNCKIG